MVDTTFSYTFHTGTDLKYLTDSDTDTTPQGLPYKKVKRFSWCTVLPLYREAPVEWYRYLNQLCTTFSKKTSDVVKKMIGMLDVDSEEAILLLLIIPRILIGASLSEPHTGR